MSLRYKVGAIALENLLIAFKLVAQANLTTEVIFLVPFLLF